MPRPSTYANFSVQSVVAAPASLLQIDLWTGDASADRAIVTGFDYVADDALLWVKSRNSGEHYAMADTVRGANKYVSSSSSSIEDTATTVIKSFNANGFNVGSNNMVNDNTRLHVGWTFKVAPDFFDIISYTGNSTSGRTIAHSLGVAPAMVMVKRLNSTASWAVQHKDLGASAVLALNAESPSATEPTIFNSTLADATNVTLGNSGDSNVTGVPYIMYVFAHKPAGEIQGGVYTGNGSATGPTINLGWDPKFILVKRRDGFGNWNVLDTTRNLDAGTDEELNLDLFATRTTADFVNLTGTGFQIVTTDVSYNNNTDAYVYLAVKA